VALVGGSKSGHQVAGWCLPSGPPSGRVLRSQQTRAEAMDSDSDVEVVGAAGFDAARDAPHARKDCLNHKWQATADSAHCPSCYCWVCDEPVGECPQWSKFCSGPGCVDSDTRMCASHCHASSDSRRWVGIRAMAQRERQSAEMMRQREAARPTGGRRAAGAAPAAAQPQQRPPPTARAQQPEATHYMDAGGMADGEAVALDEEQEELFEHYRPRHWKHGCDHPDPVVETTSLAFASAPSLPADQESILPNLLPSAKASRSLSALQLEAVAYAFVRHGQQLPSGETAGFFLGDGPGVGKGRQLAGLIVENWLQGRQRHVWLSVSPDLEHDARRDIEDITRHMGREVGSIPLFNLSKLPYRDLMQPRGVMFATYAALVSKEGNASALYPMPNHARRL
jgi:hypothetical protein